MDRIDRQELTYTELTALVDGLLADHTSHTFASLAGYSYVPAPAEVAFYDELDTKLAMNRGKNQPRPPRTKRPWEDGKPQTVAPSVSADSRARRERLNEKLGLLTT